MPCGNFETESGRPCLHGCWKLTDIKLTKKMNRGVKRHKEGAEKKREKSQRALLAGVKNAAK